MIEIRNIVDQKLNQIFINHIEYSKAKFSHSFIQNLNQLHRVVMLKGAKRIRPILVFIGHQLITGLDINQIPKEKMDDLLNLACGLEIFHTFALIHDDIIDQGLSRRGAPTIEASYRDFFSKFYGGSSESVNHFALGSTILAGDLALSLADTLIGKINNQKLREYYGDMQFELIAGQIDDCYGVGLADLDELEEEQILQMMRAKSGNYSITRPVIMGALVGGESEVISGQIDILNENCQKIGLIFQLTDDFIGLFGKEDITGKSTIGDIVEGKKTLLILRTYKKSTKLEQLRIKNILGNGNSKMEDINWLKNHIINLNVYSDLKNHCSEIEGEIIKSFSQFPPQTQLLNNKVAIENIKKGCQFMIEFTEYLLERDK